ncbi:negative transcriptional regulator, PaiB family [Pedobacter westerhofensis]|uniref:Negative transcriptional regulator, PaiB family n=1 Tax=Pedobacter westerhofensis TaxID=425512 RepID=A0A521CET4_9SPHI|nr:FMN-binding negative transcriptional regulator [Pedobacter westerhofensis]SMO57939.1 negative transcriptional regulator, PaiB family [Pedobacter westerhofensis]
MYIPKANQISDRTEIVSFMKRFSFATLISAIDNVPQATHLPLTVKYDHDDIILTGHFAKANLQWKNIEEQSVLVIFSEPHAYISPKLYDKIESVPTWNYYAVHAYGKCTVLHERSQILHALEDMILAYEADYKMQWDSLSDSFKDKMLNGIVPFTMTVTDLQASQKLSQNKTTLEQERIIKHLAESNDSSVRITGEYMESNIKKNSGLKTR